MLKHSFIVKDKKFKGRKFWGQADVKSRVIHIDPRLDRDEYIRTLVHESLHVLAPFLDEEYVEQWGVEIGNVVLQQLINKGYLE